MLWAAWWVFFAVASALSEPGSVAQKVGVILVATVFFLGSTLVPLRYERLGGFLLLVEGVALCIANYTFLRNRPATQVFLLLTLALPPLLAGILFLTMRPHPYSASER